MNNGDKECNELGEGPISRPDDPWSEAIYFISCDR